MLREALGKTGKDEKLKESTATSQGCGILWKQDWRNMQMHRDLETYVMKRVVGFCYIF